MSHQGYVIVSETSGIFVGTFWGMAFWSNVDTVGQTCAPTFATEMEAMNFIRGEDVRSTDPTLRYVLVETAEPCYATAQELVLAGLVDEAQPLLMNQRE